MNPRKMQQMMKQLGIQQVDIAAEEVIIRTAQKDIIISQPSVAKVNMMGQETFQISGTVTERKRGISEEDIETVMEQTNASRENVQKALEDSNGDLAQAIINLRGE